MDDDFPPAIGVVVVAVLFLIVCDGPKKLACR